MNKTPKIAELTDTDAEIRRTRRDTAERDAVRPRAVAAYYVADDHKISITLQHDMEIRIPVKNIQGLEAATPSQLANITLTANGNALHWDEVDIQMSVEGLVAGIFGTQAWMKQLQARPTVEHAAAALGRIGGRVRSAAKAAAVRENGKKGGRPPKQVASQP